MFESQVKNSKITYIWKKLNQLIFRSLNGAEPNYHLLNVGYNVFKSKSEFKLFHGGILPEIQIAYETYGTLNKERDNAILLFTGLSANSHAKSHKVRKNFELQNNFFLSLFLCRIIQILAGGKV